MYSAMRRFASLAQSALNWPIVGVLVVLTSATAQATTVNLTLSAFSTSIPGASYGGAGQWDITVTEVTPTVWDYTVSADASNAPNLPGEVLSFDFRNANSQYSPPVVSMTGQTNSAWYAQPGAVYYQANPNIAPLPGSPTRLLTDGSNFLSGQVTFASAPTANPATYFDVAIFNYSADNNGASSVIYEWRNPLDQNVVPTPVPLPAAAWLMLSGLGALGVLMRKKRAA